MPRAKKNEKVEKAPAKRPGVAGKANKAKAPTPAPVPASIQQSKAPEFTPARPVEKAPAPASKVLPFTAPAAAEPTPVVSTYLEGPILEVAQVILETLAALQAKFVNTPATDKAKSWEENKAELGDDFAALFVKTRALGAIKEWAESQGDAIKKELVQRLEIYGIKETAVGFYKLIHQNGCSEPRIDALKLAQLGVPAETIKAATNPGTPYAYIQPINCGPRAKKAQGEEAEQ